MADPEVRETWNRIRQKLRTVDVNQMTLQQLQLAKIKIEHDLKPIQERIERLPRNDPQRHFWQFVELPLLHLSRNLQYRFQDIRYQHHERGARMRTVVYLNQFMSEWPLRVHDNAAGAELLRDEVRRFEFAAQGDMLVQVWAPFLGSQKGVLGLGR
jgi:hypothetical protein